ncbi:MAG: 2-succinyl-5-enolpyruvyl-6-hydroxy-3-cyclohexene-1-carboxylate synthase [Syntrophus sp. SKADARSKE-3]|nr:2-succinyl-5-enolpyruvyl-6-hydroxy-3-cyclohexene-1-carboxylate synthase [Syntrophus sp. SKADARSKE-3]
MPELPLSDNLNLLWSSLIVTELIKNGLDTFFISPGNRNAPLISALAYEERAIKKGCLDERAAAYRALGHAKATGRPGVVVCTSGTAPANYFPAVIEAFREDIPLVVLSADRPPELVGSDANQTIIQEGLYGMYCRKVLHLPAPSVDYPLEALLAKIDYIVSAPQGPVHINCPFRDPLTPGITACRPLPEDALTVAKYHYTHQGPYTVYPPQAIHLANLGNAADILRKTKRGLAIVGRLESPDDAPALEKLLHALGWPIFCDIASGMKGRVPPDRQIFTFDHPEALRLVREYNPDTILQFGSGLVSKQYEGAILPQSEAVMIQVSPRWGLRDPAHRVRIRITASARDFAAALDLQEPLSVDGDAHTRLLMQMAAIHDSVREKIPADRWSFPGIASAVLGCVPDGEGLFIGNSLAIRAFDGVCCPYPKRLFIISNRGVSGIEGHLATSVGFAEASGLRVTAVVGDISLLHDLNSLIMVSGSLVPVVIVVVNNGGGRIFERLPIRDFPEIMEPWMTTPHTMDFKHVAAQFDLPYIRVNKPDELMPAYKEALDAGRSAMVEIVLSPEDDLWTFRAMQAVRLG